MDLFQLHLTQLVANAVGLASAANVTTQVLHINGDDDLEIERYVHQRWGA